MQHVKSKHSIASLRKATVLTGFNNTESDTQRLVSRLYFLMLNSHENENFLVIYFKMPTIVGILISITRIKTSSAGLRRKFVDSFVSILIYNVYEEYEFHAHVGLV